VSRAYRKPKQLLQQIISTHCSLHNSRADEMSWEMSPTQHVPFDSPRSSAQIRARWLRTGEKLHRYRSTSWLTIVWTHVSFRAWASKDPLRFHHANHHVFSI
jgi:hypothetical protein